MSLSISARVRAAVARVWRRTRREPPAGDWFQPADIARIHEVYFGQGTAPGGAWDRYRDAHMVLPVWFRHDLDPWGEAYAAQQHRLWSLVTGVDRVYDVEVDEREHAWGDIDPVRQPGFYVRRDDAAVSSAGDQLIAMGMLLKHAGLRPGDRALEYGAGFAQGALAMARLGVEVDTVDVSPTFCHFVRRQAEHFNVPLTPHVGQFGMQPHPGQRYKLVWFYESFHHCVDFLRVVPRLAEMLEPGGRVILAGEPVVEQPYAAVPYPWGVRLHSEVAAVMRQNHWFELGFTEAFLYELFARAGFESRRIDCDASPFGRLYVFERAGTSG